jgi:hypothetical protein
MAIGAERYKGRSPKTECCGVLCHLTMQLHVMYLSQAAPTVIGRPPLMRPTMCRVAPDVTPRSHRQASSLSWRPEKCDR